MEDIIRKLTSRKFWTAIIAFVTGLLIYFGKTAEDAEKIAALIMSGASMLAYIIGEGLVDAASVSGDNHLYFQGGQEEDKPPEEEG